MSNESASPGVILAFQRPPAPRSDLDTLLQRIRRARIGVIGDFCLDVYWTIDASASETSVETGLPTRPVRTQRCSLGGAGNVVANLLALQVRQVRCFSVIGDDPFGREMRRILEHQRAELTGLLVQPEDWSTHVYIKPVNEGREENRIDLGNFNHLHPAMADRLADALADALPHLDVVIINEQIGEVLHSPHLRERINDLIARHPQVLFIADCRHLSEHYPHCLHKMNDHEAARICGLDRPAGEPVGLHETRWAARRLFERWNRPVFVTRGARGCIVVDHHGEHVLPGLHIVRKTDPVGAGDSLVAGLAAAMATGAGPAEAATFGNLVAGVTVQKLFQTGTATPDEVRALGASPDYVYEPELADDARAARYLEGTQIEVINPLPQPLALHCAIFDHDGTLSTLRQGWEEVMEPMMVRAILGDYYEAADQALYHRVRAEVRDFIDKTTGIQTLAQMQGLVDLVRDFGMVPPEAILDAAGYKRIYNEALMTRVGERLARLERGELGVADFTIKNAPELLHRLHAAGVKLYLASGTDEADVVREATALGYAPLFEGRIFGAVGNLAVEAKRVVLERILADIGPDEAGRIVTFGDGPVEIRETRKRGGVTVGVASNEVQRFGLSLEKRSRLIRAGADLVVPDFSQLDALLALLRIGRPAEAGAARRQPARAR